MAEEAAKAKNNIRKHLAPFLTAYYFRTILLLTDELFRADSSEEAGRIFRVDKRGFLARVRMLGDTIGFDVAFNPGTREG